MQDAQNIPSSNCKTYHWHSDTTENLNAACRDNKEYSQQVKRPFKQIAYAEIRQLMHDHLKNLFLL